MSTANTNYALDAVDTLQQARPDIVAFETAPVLRRSSFPFPINGEIARLLPVLVMVSAFTGSIKDFDHVKKPFQQDVFSSATTITQPKENRRISLRTARQIALQILAETEKNLHEERMAEARFIAGLWDNET
jgi:hypothetical protein